MPETLDSHRERKKQRTRRAVSEAALRLFVSHGYDETTVTDIATAAEIAPRTFFSYFRAKDDVLFAGIDERITFLLSEVELRQPGERLPEAARRVISELMAVTNRDDLAGEHAEILWRIIGSRPSLQGALLLRVRAAEQELAARLLTAYAGELDEVVAAALVGLFASGLRAAVRPPSGAESSVGQQQVAVERLFQLLEHGLGDVIRTGSPGPD